ncbi:MAG TPA: ATP-grasp domain-containing protein [Phycisphaerae bacterium]|nr:ATP-grasp domain-containing protein [Phycisphaerae bacterium]
MGEPLNILLTGAGWRISLVEAFRRALADLSLKGRVLVAEQSPLAPAFHLADEGFLVPLAADAHHVEALLAICRRHKVGLVIPLADEDVEAASWAREQFTEAGARVLVSSPQVVEICRDRQRTFDFLKAVGLRTPEVLTYAEALAGRFPLAVNRRVASSARAQVVPDRETLEECWADDRENVILTRVDGDEFSVDVYAGLDGVPRVAVPREALELRGNAICKAKTVRHPEIIHQSMVLAGALRECVGVISIRCFLSGGQDVTIAGVSPHFDGGAALSIRAGADFPRWIIQEHLGRKPDCDPDGWQDGLVMLQYDREVFCRAVDIPMAWSAMFEDGALRDFHEDVGTEAAGPRKPIENQIEEDHRDSATVCGG